MRGGRQMCAEPERPTATPLAGPLDSELEPSLASEQWLRDAARGRGAVNSAPADSERPRGLGARRRPDAPRRARIGPSSDESDGDGCQLGKINDPLCADPSQVLPRPGASTARRRAGRFGPGCSGAAAASGRRAGAGRPRGPCRDQNSGPGQSATSGGPAGSCPPQAGIGHGRKLRPAPRAPPGLCFEVFPCATRPRAPRAKTSRPGRPPASGILSGPHPTPGRLVSGCCGFESRSRTRGPEMAPVRSRDPPDSDFTTTFSPRPATQFALALPPAPCTLSARMADTAGLRVRGRLSVPGPALPSLSPSPQADAGPCASGGAHVPLHGPEPARAEARSPTGIGVGRGAPP